MTPGNFSVTFLGISAASLSPASSTSCYLVEVNQSRILIDAGIGALRQLRRIKVNPEDIDTILITHWHIDHFAGLPAILKARHELSHLSMYGPPISLPAHLYLALLFGRPGLRFEAITDDFSRSYSDFHLQAIANSHAVTSYGWKITEKIEVNPDAARRIVFSGDTRPTEALAIAAREADLLVHEATYLDKDAGTALRHQHSTAKEAAETALGSRVGALVLTHIPNRYSRLEIEAEAEKIFPGVFVPAPLDTIYLTPVENEGLKEKPGWGKVHLESRVPPTI